MAPRAYQAATDLHSSTPYVSEARGEGLGDEDQVLTMNLDS